MTLFRVLWLSLGTLFSGITVLAQTVEVFVETGVPITGEPGGRSLEEIRDETMTINKDGVVIFSARWTVGEFIEESFLKATDVNQVSYLIGDYFVLPNGEEVAGIDTDELFMNESGDFAFVAESFEDPISGDSRSLILMGKYDNEDKDFKILDFQPYEIYDISESGKVLYTGETEENGGVEQLLIGSRARSTILLQEDTLISAGSTAIWEGVHSEDTSASFMKNANPPKADSVLFSNGFWVNGVGGGYTAFYHDEGDQTQLYAAPQSDFLAVQPYDETRYLLWIDSPEFSIGWYLLEMGSALTGGNLIAPAEKYVRPIVIQDGTLYISTSNGGISKFKPNETPLTQIVSPADADGNPLDVLGISDSGLLIFVSRIDDEPQSLFSYDTSDGLIIRFIGPGLMVDGKAITAIGDNQGSTDEDMGWWRVFPMSGNYLACWSNLGIIRVNLAPDLGPVFTVSELCPEIPKGFVENQSFDEGENLYPDPFTSNDPIDLREGPCGGNWHTRIWKDPATETELDWIPGTPDHAEDSVAVENTVLEISDGPITLRSANLTGALRVNQPLTLARNSNIENLILNSNLSNGELLLLKGDNSWNKGFLSGTGPINIPDSSSTLIINGFDEFLGFESELLIGGKVRHISADLNLSGNASLIISNGGEYQIEGDITIASEQANAKFSLNNGSKLVIGVSADPVKIDIPLFTSGKTTIELARASVLDISQTATFNKTHEEDINHFIVQTDAHLNFKAPQTFDVKTSLLGHHGFLSTPPFPPTFRPVITTSHPLTINEETSLKGDLNFELGGDLDVSEGQLRVSQSSHLIWNRGTIKGGDFTEPTILQNGIVVEPGGKMTMGAGIPEGGFKLDGKIDNKGNIEFKHSLNLMDNAELLNEGFLELQDNSSIREATNASGLIRNTGTIEKSDSGVSEIYVPLKDTNGSIELSNFVESTEKTLILRRKSEFHGESSLLVDSPNVVEFRHPFGEQLVIHGDLFASGSGTAKVFNADVLIKSTGTLFASGGTVSRAAGEEKLFEGTNGWVIDGGTITIEDGGILFVSNHLTWRKGTITGPMTDESGIQNDGVVNITGNDLHKLDALLDNRKQLTIESSISGTGKINNLHNTEAAGTVILDNDNAPIDLGVLFSNESKVRTEFKTQATISKNTDQFTSTFFGTGQLSGGEWIVKDQAELTLTLDGENKDIRIIKDGAIVELRGSGNLNNLRTVMGDLDIRDKGQLHYRDVNNAFVDGQINLYESGELRLFNSNLIITGNLEMGSDPSNPFANPTFARLEVGSGSKLSIQDQFEILESGLVQINGILQAQSLDIERGANFRGLGLIQTVVDGSIGVFRFTNSGKLFPGNSPGILTIEGDYIQTDTGELIIEVGGTVPGEEHDQLIVDGIVTLAGTLIIYNIDNYDWSSTTPIPVIQANSYLGMFELIIVAGGSSRRTATLEIAGELLSVTADSTTYLNFGDWRGAHFTETDLLDETVSGSLADPDLDGTGNFLEYVFDYVPQFADAQEPIFDIQLNEAEDKLLVGVIFPWAKGMTDVEYTLQTSLDLKTWIDMESTVAETIEGEFIDLITLTAEVDSTGNIPLYGRLLVKEIEL